jgi:hypothetical protein
MTNRLQFVEQDRLKGRQTRRFVVVNSAGAQLGIVKWHTNWRCYVMSFGLAIFDRQCLTEVIAFIDSLHAERKGYAGVD